MTAPPPRRSPGRRAAFAAAAVILSMLCLEGVSFVVLGFVEDDAGLTPRDPGGWLVNAQLAFERGFYQPDPHTLWRARPGFVEQQTPERFWGDSPLVLNEHGHRSPPMAKEKPTDVRRVLLLGGSHPFGMWVEREESYAGVLEARLGAGWQVLNAACPGHTTFQGAEYLEHYGMEFSPDIVLFDLGVNDELPLTVDFARPDHEVAAVPWWLTRLRTGLGRTSTYLVLRELLATTRSPTVGGVRVPPEQRRDNVARVLATAEVGGARVLLFSQMEAGPGGLRCVERYDGLGTTFDACAVFSGHGQDVGRFFVDPIHANAQGHRMLGEALYARLRSLGWIDLRPRP